ncbi:MAG: SDR family oxidoreductase [Actinobacteria bacterium]|nr:SDR family oxidoreductase [Actinomycetota bacterium]
MGTLSEKVILVTGSSKGIGCATTELLGKEGASVIAQYGTDYEGAVEATKGIPSERKLLLHADFNEPGAAKNLWKEAVAWKGRIDVLVANAAMMPEASFTDSDEDWESAWFTALQVNTTSPAFLIREAVNHFLSRGGGDIIGISSWAAQRGAGNTKLGAYSASKAGIAAFLKTVARAYGKDGIYTYLISPGVVRTAMSVTSAKSQGGEEKITASLAMGEWVPPTDIGEMVAFLATGKQKHLSGSTLDINGASYIR